MSTPSRDIAHPPTLALIAAVADNGVIGADGGMPWRLSADMKRFRALTMGKPVVMGRKTYDSLGKPLEGRTNIVITRGALLAPPAITVPSVQAGLAAGYDEAKRRGVDEVMVLGGGTIYAATISLADRLYITHVHSSPDGDTWFPAIQSADFEVVSSEETAPGPRDSHAATFVIYQRRNR
ncbi:MAG: dihydrofolate reductase [Bauldia sp.]|nr:dihydrofolate reductase [Bauldia sp.]MCW5716443.1 dihydrofolate reductase [Bauldia sp.]